jgi:hypothetical protein
MSIGLQPSSVFKACTIRATGRTRSVGLPVALACQRNVAVSTQRQALSALLQFRLAAVDMKKGPKMTGWAGGL